MDFKNHIILFIILLVSLSPCRSQTNDSVYFQNFQIYPSDSNKLFLQIDNANFIKNNEYFGNIAEGYTLLGFNLTPKFVYYPNSRIKLSAGGNFTSYYGRENEINASLLLTFQYKVLPHFDFVLGNIYGTLNHKLIDPLFDFERYLSNNIENGVQFLWNSDRIFTDLWLNWEQQIFQDDPFQEKFNVGLSSEFILLQKDQYELSIPFQNLIRHEGGQINSNSDEPLKTIFNNATGLRFSKNINHKLIHKFDVSSFIVNYQDMSPNKQQMYIDGTASFTSLELTNTNFDFLVGYWYGKQFISPIGNPIYESYSRTMFYVEEPIRQLIIGKLNYQKNVYSGINMGFRFETYYDLLWNNLEYTWTVMVVLNERFFLKAF
jgi:hypothetical protein